MERLVTNSEGTEMYYRLFLILLVSGLTVSLTSKVWPQTNGGNAMVGPTEAGFINVPDGQLYYDTTGHGTPMVMLHDGLMHREVWNHQVAAWSDRYTCIRYDRRGFGKSPSPTEPYSNVNDCLAIFDSLGIQSAILVGMSAGGRLAIDFTLAHPERVSYLILSGAAISGFTFSDHFITRGGRLPDAIYGDRDKYIRFWMEDDVYESHAGNDEARAEAKALMAANPHNADFLKDRLAQPPEQPALGHLQKISVPTLVLTGEYDSPDMQAAAGAIAAAVPNAVRVVLNDAGHRLPMEQPGLFNNAVMTFLAETEFFGVLQDDGVAAAATLFKAKRGSDPKAILFTENRLNQVGYQHLQHGDIDGAVILFKWGVEAYPLSGNVWDSYAEALLASGDTAGAILNYEKSLGVNPANANAVTVLKNIRAKP